MRLGHHASRLFGTVAFCGWAFAVASCVPLPLCDENPDYCDLRLIIELPKKCIPRELGSGAPDDSCGVFVSASGKSGARGTMADPVPTLRAAVEIWKSKSPPTPGSKPSVYLCAEPITEEDGKTDAIPSGVPIFGSLDCAAGWVYTTAKRTTLTAPAGQVPLRLSGAEIKITDVDVEAATVPDTMPGVSSIAIIAENAVVEFDGSTIIAGDGARGIPGEPHATDAQGGMDGKPGTEACNIDAGETTDGTKSTCGAESSKGGDGGPGAPALPAGDGTAGTPGSLMNGGQGQESAAVTCTDGVAGDVGMTGDPGLDAMGLGKINAAEGYIGLAGQEGKPGTIGQGGGGGGGTMSNPAGTQMCGSAFPGASGGAGGTGGCGGVGGRGGGAAGSSIGIVSINSTFKFTASIVRVGNGGPGGEGGPGQTGGPGGMGGMGGASVNGVAAGCNGGAGGKGGDGGKGGNGLGGHVIGIAYTGLAPVLENPPTFELTGEPGEGAVKKDVQDFPP